MTTEEFSNEFDTLLNSYALSPNKYGMESSPLTIELDEYEKSVFLTKAQEDIVISLYNGKNPTGDSFEKTEEIRRYLSDLVKTYTTTKDTSGTNTGINSDSIFFSLPDDLWFITYESVRFSGEGCLNGEEVPVIPTTQDDITRSIRDPFRRPDNKRALRLDLGNNKVEIITGLGDSIDRYLVRYVTKPDPIILVNLPDALSINGVKARTECKLNPAIHRSILERAVQLALLSRTTNITKQ